MRKQTLLVVVALLSFGFWILPTMGQELVDGYWKGVIAQQGEELSINVEFKTAPDSIEATIDIPDLYILGYKLANVRYEPPTLSFELPLGREADRFDGVLTGENISGTYSGRLYKTELQSATFLLRREKKPKPVYRQEEVNFYNGEVKLAGTLLTPLNKGLHPAVVFFHGSGPQTRESYLRFFADLFARRGIATLIYDKRGTGDSTGEVWYRTGDRFDDLVGDALSGVQLLLNRKDIHPKKIGLWGLSQGGWLAPMAASRSEDIAFLIVVSGGGVTPAEQEIYDDEAKLRDMGFPPEEIVEAVALLKLADDVVRKRVTWEQFAAVREQAQQKAWYAHLDRFPLKLPEEAPIWQGSHEELDFDPRPLWEKLRIPVLALFGEEDKSTPAAESVRRIEIALKQGGNKSYSIKIFPKADHGLWVAPETGKSGWDRPAPGWLDMMTDWLVKQGN